MSSRTPDIAAARTLLDALPFARALALRAELVEGRLAVRMPCAAHLIGNARLPALHGGAIASLLQLTASVTLAEALGVTRPPAMFSITTEYLRSGLAEDLVATATIVTRSRRYANLRVEARQAADPRATAAATVQFRLVD
jgi:uncharacterized protein (TIGR00369 family)